MDFNKMMKAYEVANAEVDPDWETEVIVNSLKVNNNQEAIFIEECTEFLTELELAETGVYDNIDYTKPGISDEGIMHICEELVDIVISASMISHKYNISNEKKATNYIKTISDIRYNLYEGIKATTKKLRLKTGCKHYVNEMTTTFQYIAEIVVFTKKQYNITDEMFNKMMNVKLARTEKWYKK